MGLHLPEMQSSLLLNKPKQVNSAEVTAPLPTGLSALGFLFKKERVNHCFKVGDSVEVMERKNVPGNRTEGHQTSGRQVGASRAMPGLLKQKGLKTDPSSLLTQLCVQG